MIPDQRRRTYVHESVGEELVAMADARLSHGAASQ